MTLRRSFAEVLPVRRPTPSACKAWVPDFCSADRGVSLQPVTVILAESLSPKSTFTRVAAST